MHVRHRDEVDISGFHLCFIHCLQKAVHVRAPDQAVRSQQAQCTYRGTANRVFTSTKAARPASWTRYADMGPA